MFEFLCFLGFLAYCAVGILVLRVWAKISRTARACINDSGVWTFFAALYWPLLVTGYLVNKVGHLFKYIALK